MFEPDEFQRKALKTWYPVNSPLHLDPLHPAIKLAGEAGELLDLYGKDRYKPEFSWWNCKMCGVTSEWLSVVRKAYDEPNMSCCKLGPFPLVLDELGDYSYYLRILTYQQETSFMKLVAICKPTDCADMPNLLSDLNLKSAFLLDMFLREKIILDSDLIGLTITFLKILKLLDCPIEHLIDLNYQKLNSDETHHGWKGAK